MDLGTVETLLLPADRAALPEIGEGDALLAGGTWLFSEPQPHLRRLVDLTALGWPALIATDEGLEIAGTCTLAELAALPVPEGWPALGLARTCCEALRGSFKVWNAATVGGNLCLALAAAPMAAFAAALEGECLIWQPGGGDRRLSVPELIVGAGRTALAPGEVLRSIRLPAGVLASRVAARQASLTPLGRSAALLVARVDDAAAEFVLTVTASIPAPVQLRLPRTVDATGLRAALIDAFGAGPEGFYDDVHGDPDWRRHLTWRLAEELRAELLG